MVLITIKEKILIKSSIYYKIKHDTRFKFLLSHNLILYLSPVLAVIGIIVPLNFKLYDLALLGSYLAIPLILAPIAYTKFNWNQSWRLDLGKSAFESLIIIYFFLFSISIFLLYNFEVRPLLYYTIITLMSGCILSQILFFKKVHSQYPMILIQIMILILDLIWGVSLKYPFYFGRTDIFSHFWLIQNLADRGFITEVFGEYKPFPLWHILVSCTSIITELDISEFKEMFLINGIIYSFLVIAIYIFSLKIFESREVALLSALFTAIYVEIIEYGMYSIPRSAISFFEVLFLSFLIYKKSRRYIFLSIILIPVMVIYHTASMPFLIVILMLIYFLEKFYNIIPQDRFTNSNFIWLCIITTLTYWMYFAERLYQTLVKSFFSVPTELISEYQRYSSFNEWINYLNYSPLLFFFILGSLYILRMDCFSHRLKIFCLIGLLLAPLTFPGPAFMMEKLFGDLRLSRFEEYSFLFINIIAAIGFSILFSKSNKKFQFIFIILFLMMVFLNISNDFVASDNPLVKRDFYTFYLDNQEISAFNHVAEITAGYLMSDYVTSRYFENSTFSLKQHILEVSMENKELLRNSSQDVILIREQELRKRPLKLLARTSKFELQPSWDRLAYYHHDEKNLWTSLEKYNKIYMSGGVTGYN